MVAVAAPSAASAGAKQETILQDDRLLGDPAYQTEALDTARDLGVDTIHAVVVWDSIAPDRDQAVKPAGFDATNPAAYGAEQWDRIDALVRGANQRRIKLLLSPSGPIPTWASLCPSPGTPKVCRPDPKEYEAFFAAVVKRYNGRTPDENEGGQVLPKVSRFSVWNEPNLGGWLQPTSENVSIYRELFYAAQRGLRRGFQPRAQLLLGELAPLNGSLPFYQRLFCIDSRGRLLKGKAAKKAGCKPGRRVKRLGATGIAHHPYARGGQPPFAKTSKNDITLRDLDRLEKVLKQAAKAGAVKRNLGIYVTEFGISSAPPSQKFGVSLDRQAREINRAEFAMYENKAVRSYAQYQLNDDIGIGREEGTVVTFQTGLRFGNGVPKPSFDAFRIPLYVTKAGKKVRVWGGVRPGARARVAIQTQAGAGWRTLATVTVNRYGYIDRKVARQRGKFRLRWVGPAGQELTSREAGVERK